MRMLDPDGKFISTDGMICSILLETDIDQLITIGGMVIRLSSLVPEMREGV